MYHAKLLLWCLIVSFVTLSICQEGNGKCYLSKDSGPCMAYFPRWYYNSASGTCDQFVYGGCQGNENNFESKSDCLAECGEESSEEEEDVCEQPKVTGPCRAYFRRWYYDSASQSCKEFVYGGCRGNDNNFQTSEECTNKCGGSFAKVKRSEDVCSLAKAPGPCYAYFSRWYFNTVSGKCEAFVFGGCQGNDNNFISKDECADTCGGSSRRKRSFDREDEEEDVCDLPKKVGPCKASHKRWYYNTDSGKCEQFTYGGCRGNDNNFESKRECRNTCGGRNSRNKRASDDVCDLPKKAGPCRAYFQRWYYNSGSAKCEQFIYGGCQGNENNFKSETACNKKCS